MDDSTAQAPELSPFRVTFGTGHHPAAFPAAHTDGWLTIMATDYDQARAAAIRLLGTAWSDIVSPESWAKLNPVAIGRFFPLGELDRVDARSVLLRPEMVMVPVSREQARLVSPVLRDWKNDGEVSVACLGVALAIQQALTGVDPTGGTRAGDAAEVIEAARLAFTQPGPRHDVLLPSPVLTSWLYELRRLIKALLELIETGQPPAGPPAVTWPVKITDMYDRDLTAELAGDGSVLRLAGETAAFTGWMTRELDRDAARTLAAALLAFADAEPR